MTWKLSLSVCFICLFCVHSQSQDLLFDEIEQASQQDTLYSFFLAPVDIFPDGVKNTRKNRRWERRYREGSRAYQKLVRNVKVVYPYAEKAGDKINEIEATLQIIEKKQARKSYLKKEYKALIAENKRPLMKLYTSQGHLLMLLIDRKTGNTPYVHIKELKGSGDALFWQMIARMFGNNLNEPYDPEGKHQIIESVVRQYEAGTL